MAVDRRMLVGWLEQPLVDITCESYLGAVTPKHDLITTHTTLSTTTTRIVSHLDGVLLGSEKDGVCLNEWQSYSVFLARNLPCRLGKSAISSTTRISFVTFWHEHDHPIQLSWLCT